MTSLAITPVVLTWNEVANIGRTLDQLEWASRVVVVDSGSDDGTREVVSRCANATLIEHTFESHSAQAEYAIRRPEIHTDWVLALDADFVLSAELIQELASLPEVPASRGFRIRVRYCIGGRTLRRSLYPPVVALFDRRVTTFRQVGHAHKAVVDGPIGDLRSDILHDDRKPFERFIGAQRRYAALEAARILDASWRDLSWSGRVRRLRWISPWLVPFYVLLGQGLILDGRAGIAYARERRIAESEISKAIGELRGI